MPYKCSVPGCKTKSTMPSHNLPLSNMNLAEEYLRQVKLDHFIGRDKSFLRKIRICYEHFPLPNPDCKISTVPHGVLPTFACTCNGGVLPEEYSAQVVNTDNTIKLFIFPQIPTIISKEIPNHCTIPHLTRTEHDYSLTTPGGQTSSKVVVQKIDVGTQTDNCDGRIKELEGKLAMLGLTAQKQDHKIKLLTEKLKKTQSMLYQKNRALAYKKRARTVKVQSSPGKKIQKVGNIVDIPDCNIIWT